MAKNTGKVREFCHSGKVGILCNVFLFFTISAENCMKMEKKMDWEWGACPSRPLDSPGQHPLLIS